MIIRKHNKILKELFIRIDNGNFEFAINILDHFVAIEGNIIKGQMQNHNGTVAESDALNGSK